MSMNDPIADLLTRVRNAIQAKHATVDVPASRLKAEICRVLREQGFIENYEVSEEPKPGLIRVTLKYLADGAPVARPACACTAAAPRSGRCAAAWALRL